MIKRFKLFEADELIEKGTFDIATLMGRIQDQENRIEFLTSFLMRVLVSQQPAAVSFTTNDDEFKDKVIVDDIRVVLHVKKEDLETVLLSIILIIDNKQFTLHNEKEITVWRVAGKTVITAEDPYGEEEWF